MAETRSLTRRTAAVATPLDDAGKLLLRLTVGVLLLLHGWFKMTHGVDGVVGMLRGAGWPGMLAYLVYLGEVVAPLALIAGYWTRPAALVAAFSMVVAVALAHAGQVLALNQQGGWAIELQGLYLLGALAVALLGAGRYSVGGPAGRFN